MPRAQAERLDYPPKLGDLKAEGIDRVKLFFDVIGLDFPINTPEWAEIQNYKTLRHCLVHARGQIDKLKSDTEREKMRAFIARETTLSISNLPLPQVTLEKGFCEKALATIERFLHSWLVPGS